MSLLGKAVEEYLEQERNERMPLNVSTEITEAASLHHPAVQEVARFFSKGEHLQEQMLKDISIAFHNLAVHLLATPGLQGPQLTVALNKLLEAKDSAVRAAL